MYRAKHYSEKKNEKAKNVILAIVAMIELLLLSTTMTFSWFEGTTALRITTDNENHSPLKTAKGLNSSYTVGGESSKYSNTAELNEYIEMQANAKFSPVSSYNGEDFFALMDGTATDGKAPDSYDDYLSGITAADSTLKFRQLSNEEKNSSLVYFQFQVNAEVCDTTFWLKKLPTFTVNGEALASDNNPFRVRICADETASPSAEGNLILTTKTAWPTTSPTQTTSSLGRINMKGIKELQNSKAVLNETYIDNNNKPAGELMCNRANYKVFSKTSTQNKNGKEVLFTVPKGETKTITMAIWLEALDQSYNSTLIPAGATVDVDIQFCSSWDVIDTITFRDYTSENWVNSTNGNYLCLINDETEYCYYDRSSAVNSATGRNEWSFEIPRAVQDITFRREVKEFDPDPSGTWTPAERGTNTTFTAFGSTAGIWYDGEVTQIGLSDYTTDSWLNNNGDDGKAPKMKVEIDYSGTDLKYSMTGTPVADKYGKNTWYAYIPSSINDVIFDRCDSTTEYVYNLWNAADRGSETIYRVYDTKKVEVDKSNTVYLQIPASIEAKFFKNQTIPHISLTGDNNVTYINSLNGNLSSLKKNNSYYPQSDTWPTNSSNLKNGQMTKIEGTFVWYYEFDSIADTDIITFWDCNSATHNDLDSDTRFAPAISFDKSKGNMFIINGYIELDDTAFTDTAYVFTGYWDFYGSESGDTEVDVTNGVWGVYTIPTGPSVNFKHYDTSISAMTASFVYENATYSVSLTKGNDNLTWSTTSIPDGVTSIDFSDGTNTWETTSRNTYCFALDKSHYEWHSTNTYNRIYLTQNYTWDDLRVYYTSGNGNSDSWPGNSMIKLKTNGDGHYVYVALVRTSPNLIVFNGTENGSRKQTKDITSNINTDLKGFYFLSWDSSVGKANTNTWDVTVDFLNQ